MSRHDPKVPSPLSIGSSARMSNADDALAVTLDLRDACALATSWVCSLAADLHIRILVIKGESLNHYGLRPQRASADVDVLVDPQHFDSLCSVLESAGWHQRAQTEVGAVWAAHSVTYLNATWPCDIDVHRYFPGFLADPSDTFEHLWATQETMTIAHRDIPIPGRAASILISGLHLLRSGAAKDDELEFRALCQTQLDQDQRDELLALAEDTGSIESAKEVLVELGIRDEDYPPRRDSPELRAWRAHIDADSSGAFYWLLLLERTPPSERLGMLRRALWPPREALLINNPRARDSALDRAAMRLSRIPGGLRGLPNAIRALVRRRQI